MGASLYSAIARSLSVTAVVALTTSSANAATFAVGASSQGFFNQLGQTNSRSQQGDIGNTFTGGFRRAGTENFTEFRSFFIFDVRNIKSPINSATLSLFQERYFSSAFTEEVTVFDVTVDAERLSTPDFTTTNLDIFEDLGNGAVYGKGVISAQPTVENAGTFVGEFLNITLSAAGVDAINQARTDSGLFAIGLAASSLDGTPFTAEFLGQDLGGAEGVRFSVGTNPHDCRGGLLVSTTGSSQSSVQASCTRASEPLPETPKSIPESPMLIGTLFSVVCGWVMLRLPSRRP